MSLALSFLIMTDSFLREKFGDISKSLALSSQTLLGFAGDLYQAKVIDQLQLDDTQRTVGRDGLLAAQTLIKSCEVAIQSNEENEGRIIKIMEKFKPLRQFILGAIDQQADRICVVPQNCGCGKCTVSQWVSGSAYCPHPKRATVQSLLVVNNQQNHPVSEFFKLRDIGYNMKLLDDTYSLKRKFTNYYLQTHTELQKPEYDEDFTSLADHIKIAFFPNQETQSIKTTHELLNYLCCTVGVSWFNFFPVRFLVHTMKNPDLNSHIVQIWDDYASDFKEYCNNRRIKDLSNLFVNQYTEINNSFVVEIDDLYNDIKLSTIESLREHISEVLGCSVTSFYLLAVGVGSLLLLFRYYLDDYLDRFGLSIQQCTALADFRECNIISLKDVNNRFEYIIAAQTFEYIIAAQTLKVASATSFTSPSHSPVMSPSSGYVSPEDTAEMQKLKLHNHEKRQNLTMKDDPVNVSFKRPYQKLPLSPATKSSHQSSSDADENIVRVDYRKFKQLIVGKSRFATAVPVLITLAGLPTTNKVIADVLSKVVESDNAVLRPESDSGIAWHELIACLNVETGQLEYKHPNRNDCYIYAAYAALKHNSRIFKQVEHFLQADDALQVDLFQNSLLNKTFKNFYKNLKRLIKDDREGQTSQPPFGKFFNRNLPNGFVFMNVWDIRLSKTVFHFLPFLNGQLSNNYLWLFLSVHDINESDSLAEIPPDHSDFERLMIWKPRLYYLMRNVYLTSKVKKTKGNPQCTMILTSDKHVTEKESQQCMKKVMEKAEEMKIEHLVDSERLCVPDDSAGSMHTCSQELKRIGDNIVTAGFHSKTKILPLSWICLRNAFFENNMLYIAKSEMQSIARELLITGSDFDDFLDYFASFGSIIDASKFGDDSPYIITYPVLFFQKLDELLYHTDDENNIFQKYGLISRNEVENVVSKEDADFFLQILLSVNLAFLLQSDQLSIPPSLFPNQPQSVYYIPVASQEKCNRDCTHSALHLHITAGQVLCRNLQVKFAQTFLKENASSAKMLIREEECFANVTSITYAGLSFDVVCHGNEAEFIVNDAQNPELYKAIINTLYAILKDLAASEPFFSFKFSFLCCKNALVSEYELNQTCHFLPFRTNDCKECEEFMSHCHSLKTWNTVLQQDDRWKEFPEFENMKEGLFSPEDGWKFATSLKSLSDDCVDQFAKLLKFDKGIQEDSLKGYKRWKRILMMILEWENESNFYTWQTAKLFREKLKKLLQHPNASLEDKEIIKKTLALDYNGTKGEVITELEKEKAVLEKLNEPESVAKVCKDDKRKLFDCSAPVAHNYISPSHIAGRKSYTLQGSKAQMLDWDDYGFMMSFPKNTLQHEEDCEVTVLALTGGNFRFPKGTELVSAVFSISFERGISRPVGVYIEHCASLETKWQTTQLRFVATTGKDHSQNKTVFNYIEGGQFEIGNKYGYMERMHFCELGVVGEKDEKSSHLNYTGCLLYETKYLNHWLLKFFVHKDIKAYEQFVTEKCDRSVVDQKIVFKFVDTYIELSLSDSVANGWRLDPHAEPLRLWKSEIDSFGSSLNSPPAACLITIYGKETPTGTEPLHHPITLNGIDCSMKTIFINRSLSEINVTPVNDLESGQRSLHNNLSRQHTDHGDAIKRLVTVIKDVLTTYEARLSPLMNLATISEFVTEMHSAKLIDRAVARNNPSYTTIIDQFTAGLVFLMEPSQIEQQCLKFFTILCDIGGPLKLASEAIKADLAKEVKKKLNMDLHFRMQ